MPEDPHLTAEWRPIPGFPIYEASSDGRVRHARTKRVLKDWLNFDGYRRVGLFRDGKNFVRGIHGFVAAAFLGPCPDGYQVNHKDGVPSNNNVSNLEYLTPRENTHDAMRRLGRGWNAPRTSRRLTHCKRGHVLDEANVHVRHGKRHGQRSCRECKRIRQRAYRVARRERTRRRRALSQEQEP